ncbi:MAG: hypothetical protein PHD97_08650 [Bacteroidales bacterium]|nr:hypothetical protein [Bacteroidales bacterium]
MINDNYTKLNAMLKEYFDPMDSFKSFIIICAGYLSFETTTNSDEALELFEGLKDALYLYGLHKNGRRELITAKSDSEIFNIFFNSTYEFSINNKTNKCHLKF